MGISIFPRNQCVQLMRGMRGMPVDQHQMNHVLEAFMTQVLSTLQTTEMNSSNAFVPEVNLRPIIQGDQAIEEV